MGNKWVEWSASRPGRFIPEKRGPGTNWRLGEPQNRSVCGGDDVKLAPAWNRIPVFELVASHVMSQLSGLHGFIK